jgi:hypothetical protein
MLVIYFIGVSAFAVLFAINSSIHSYLVLRYADGDKVSTSVGFYYMANAGGRLSGTLCSGAIYSYVDPDFSTRGMGYCFLAGVLSSIAATLVTYMIKDDVAGLQCGSCVCIDTLDDDEGEGETQDLAPNSMT